MNQKRRSLKEIWNVMQEINIRKPNSIEIEELSNGLNFIKYAGEPPVLLYLPEKDDTELFEFSLENDTLSIL